MQVKPEYLMLWRIFTTLLLIILLCAFVRHYYALKPCGVTYPNGSKEEPGLYGNCDYLDEYQKTRTTIKEEEWLLTQPQ